ncbi:hypothetical protein FWH09_01355 [Candidatus Saccharibacteria bacterium]|nr:hypothetical protein [Candidatus Saccharibacteria bacterium]
MAKTEDKRTVSRGDLAAKARKTMMITVVMTSIVVGLGLVGIRRLIIENIFLGRVIIQKNETINNLRDSQRNLPNLENAIRILSVNEDLMAARFDEEQDTLRVVPDALPSVYNEAGLGASLAERLLRVDGATIESVRTGNSALATAPIPISAEGLRTANFTFTISGDENAIKQVLENLEKSIRFITVGQINITYSGRIQMSVRGVAYYVDESIVQLTSTTIRAGGGN